MITKPFEPFVTVWEAAYYEKDKPETSTKSIFLNAVLDAMEEVKKLSSSEIARYMKIEPRLLNCGMKLVTGMTYTEFRHELTKVRIQKMRSRVRGIDDKEIARRLKYSPAQICRLSPREEWSGKKSKSNRTE